MSASAPTGRSGRLPLRRPVPGLASAVGAVGYTKPATDAPERPVELRATVGRGDKVGTTC
jgi:hypothetical protein